jgi:hypothetical protein
MAGRTIKSAAIAELSIANMTHENLAMGTNGLSE